MFTKIQQVFMKNEYVFKKYGFKYEPSILKSYVLVDNDLTIQVETDIWHDLYWVFYGKKKRLCWIPVTSVYDPFLYSYDPTLHILKRLRAGDSTLFFDMTNKFILLNEYFEDMIDSGYASYTMNMESFLYDIGFRFRDMRYYFTNIKKIMYSNKLKDIKIVFSFA